MCEIDWYRGYIASWGKEKPSQFAAAFAKTIPIKAGETSFLDAGCGSGIIGIYCLVEKKALSVTFTDIEQYWVDTARRNVALKIEEGLISPEQVRFLPASGFAEIPYEEVARHHLVGFNAPQLPLAYVDEETRRKIEGDPLEKHFRFGGEWGLDIVAAFLAWYASLPFPKPDAVILLSSFLGRKRINKLIAASGLQLRGKPVETDAKLRQFFWKQAEAFSKVPSEVKDRSIRKVDGAWLKKLLTYRLTNKR
jgi:methylase of polypeptide subunit release factors